MGGTITFDGRDIADLRGSALRQFRRRDVSFVFQDPRAAINPIQQIGDFLLEEAKDSGEDMWETRRRAVELLRRMGIDDAERRMRQYPFQLSGGLLQRVMIAAGLLPRPRLLLADEPTTALDVTTQSDVLALTDELRREQGGALIFVTHDIDLAMAVCDRIVVLYAGRVLEVAEAAPLHSSAVHPYTRGLMDSRPPLDRRLVRLPSIEGVPIAAGESGPGCPFVRRCSLALPVCGSTLPELTPTGHGLVRCHRATEIMAARHG
jgi:oligopeptide/dipeptide ABC transporter ATP-binding protein